MSALRACGAGHVCCTEPDGPPLHDHFLSREDCPACNPAHPVQGEARAETTARMAEARLAYLNSYPTAQPDEIHGFNNGFRRGWDARAARVSREVEALNEQLIELCEIVGAERATLTEKVRANAHASAEAEQLKAALNEAASILAKFTRCPMAYEHRSAPDDDPRQLRWECSDPQCDASEHIRYSQCESPQHDAVAWLTEHGAEAR